MTSYLTLGNPKTVKGESLGYLTAILHLAPANVAGLGTVCASATPGCMATCLNTAGRGGMWSKATGGLTASARGIQAARVRRTLAYFADASAFHDALDREIRSAERRARAHGLQLAVRLNGTSDLPGLALAMATRMPDVRFYDYTKHPQPWKRIRANYALTFSRSESNLSACWDALDHGVNVAVVFSTTKGQALPASWHGYPVLDGDVSDLRFLDAPGHVVGLRAKGRARKDATGFVVPV